MDFIAALLVIALIGFIVAIGFIIAVVLNFKKVPQRIVTVTSPAKDSAIEVFNTGKGIVEVGNIRYDGYVKQGKRIYKSVKETSDEVGTAAKSVDVNEARNTFKAAAAAVNAAQEGLSAARAVLDILNSPRREK